MPGGVGAWGGAWIPMHTQPPWTEFLTHACENITFPQLLLRAVIIQLWKLDIFSIFFTDPARAESNSLFHASGTPVLSQV